MKRVNLGISAVAAKTSEKLPFPGLLDINKKLIYIYLLSNNWYDTCWSSIAYITYSNTKQDYEEKYKINLIETIFLLNVLPQPPPEVSREMSARKL